MNISAVVEVNVWDRMRNSRRQSPPLAWLFRLAGVGYLVWIIAFDLPIPYILVAVLAGLAPELRGIFIHLSRGSMGVRTATSSPTKASTSVHASPISMSPGTGSPTAERANGTGSCAFPAVDSCTYLSTHSLPWTDRPSERCSPNTG